MKNSQPIFKDLVLVGGGHANIQVLKKLSMKPIKHVRVTLISDKLYAPYSGMLPGFLAGWYSFDEVHFDLAKICQRAGAQFIHDEVISINGQDKTISLKNYPKLNYDVAAINVGIRPALAGVQADSKLLALKPISEFLVKWDDFSEQIQNRDKNSKLVVSIVGGGAAGVEIALLVKKKITNLGLKNDVHLLQKSAQLLDGYGAMARSLLAKELEKNEIIVHLNSSVVKYSTGQLYFADQKIMLCDYTFWATQAEAPKWLASSGFAVDERGFLKTNENLQVLGVEDLLAAGDCIHFAEQNLKKSGVYAVRQGVVLAENIKQRLLGKSILERYIPQGSVLALVTTGEKEVVASKGSLGFKSKFLWRLKDFIDRRFMEKFQNFSGMKEPIQYAGEVLLPAGEDLELCGGCGSKVGPSTLGLVLKDLPIFDNELVMLGVKDGEDAAVTQSKANQLTVSTVDYFRSFTNDLYLFGQIGAIHALSDVYAMGAIADTAMCIVNLPNSSQKILIQDLRLIMKGVSDTLIKEQVALIGGHSVLGHDLSLGLSVSGSSNKESLLLKSGLKIGDKLILTKPIGTGTILKAHMSGEVSGSVLENCFSSMLVSNRKAVEVMKSFKVHACTDVTGFGFGGHLLEMLQKSQVQAQINISGIPMLDGADKFLQAGFDSNLAEKNFKYISPFFRPAIKSDYSGLSSKMKMLCDPQTSGGLLIGVSEDDCQALQQQLREAGYASSAVVGTVTGAESAQLSVIRA